MSRLPRLKGREMVAFLEQQGFNVIRVRGSHHFLERGPLRTCVPVHAGKNLKVGTLRGILRDIEISPARFVELLKS